MQLTGARAWQTTQRNLELCFPQLNDNERNDLAKKSLDNTCMVGIEAFGVWQRDWAQLEPWLLEVEGAELFDKALKDERGLIMLGLHHGNWELGCKYLASKAPSVVYLYKPNKNYILEQLITKNRLRQKSVNLQPPTLKGVRSVIKELRSGGTTSILPDQIPNEENSGTFVPFFGMPAFYMTMVQKLQKKTNAQILITYTLRTSKGFRIVIQQPDPQIFDKDMEQSMIALNSNIEDIIKLSPEQYQWDYKRFRVRPDSDEDLYDC